MNSQRIVNGAFVLGALSLFVLALGLAEAEAGQRTFKGPPSQVGPAVQQAPARTPAVPHPEISGPWVPPGPVMKTPTPLPYGPAKMVKPPVGANLPQPSAKGKFEGISGEVTDKSHAKWVEGAPTPPGQVPSGMLPGAAKMGVEPSPFMPKGADLGLGEKGIIDDDMKPAEFVPSAPAGLISPKTTPPPSSSPAGLISPETMPTPGAAARGININTYRGLQVIDTKPGQGDGGQGFVMKKAPLTYIPAAPGQEGGSPVGKVREAAAMPKGPGLGQKGIVIDDNERPAEFMPSGPGSQGAAPGRAVIGFITPPDDNEPVQASPYEGQPVIGFIAPPDDQ